jgi:hypothetical protein
MKKTLSTITLLFVVVPVLALAQSAPTISRVDPTSTGPGGQVTIYGSNLWDNILVIDGETAPTWEYNSSLDSTGNTIIFNAPSQMGSHTIQIEQRIVGGRSNSMTLMVVPQISGISPSVAKTGDEVTIYGANLYGDGVVFDGANLDSNQANYSYQDASNSMSFTVPSFASVGTHTIQVEQRIVGGRSNSLNLTVIATPAYSVYTYPVTSPTISIPAISGGYTGPTTVAAPVKTTVTSNTQNQQLIVQLQQLLASLMQQLIALLQTQQSN